jgi:transposase
MMGRLERDQGQLFYSFCLEEVVPDDHQVRAIASVLDLSWVYGELSPHYPALGRPSIDPILMIRMLILGYAFGLRSERLLCREVRVNLAYRWFCGLSIEDKIPDHSVFSRARNEQFRDNDIFRRVFERVVEACISAGLVGGKEFAVDASLIAADANKQRSIPGTSRMAATSQPIGSGAGSGLEIPIPLYSPVRFGSVLPGYVGFLRASPRVFSCLVQSYTHPSGDNYGDRYVWLSLLVPDAPRPGRWA